MVGHDANGLSNYYVRVRASTCACEYEYSTTVLIYSFHVSARLEMLQEAMSTALCLSCSLLLGVCFPAEGAGATGPLPALPPERQSGEPDLEDWGSGSSLLHLLHSFPADSPFITETPGKPVNCTQRFWLPPSSAICWENIAGPEEFARSRLLVLQNRAFLQAVSTTSGVEEGGVSYQLQAREEVQGINSDHMSAVETMQTMEKEFASLEETRKEGKEDRTVTRWAWTIWWKLRNCIQMIGVGGAKFL